MSRTRSLGPEEAGAPQDAGGNKTEAAYRVLRRAILETELAPGTPLRQRLLFEVYGIGWTPLREALSRLEAERLVTMQRNRGFAVAPVSLADLADLTRARRAIEGVLLAESIKQGNEAWEDALVAAHYRLEKCSLKIAEWSETSISVWLDRHQAFHRALVGGSSSSWLMHLYNQTMDQERRQHRVLMFEPSLRGSGLVGPVDPASPLLASLLEAVDICHHTELMEATLARDVARAGELMIKHVQYKGEVFSHSERVAALAGASSEGLVKESRSSRTRAEKAVHGN
jgi:GntR family carbon starvation induced transcriptional regulator